jgi:hypothetical protein
MRCFRCDSCGMMVFFQNDRCVKCNHTLGFLPDVMDLSALETAADNQWLASSPSAPGRAYRKCANTQQFRVCNWMVPENDPNPFCVACRLNEVIPDLTDTKNVVRWTKLELAKRRCIYTFLKLGLPLENATEGGQPSLRFRFLQDRQNAPVKTGHQDGVITVNIAEADEDEREHRRLQLHEPYRTLVGHLRHESGHYYWDRLIANSQYLERFRELFGDETVNYDSALQTYYKEGPPSGWQNRTVTAYASSHPWEDWAETWAHYLHIMDTLETAASFGMSIDPDNKANNGLAKDSPIKFDDWMDFDILLAEWIPLTCALNSINRGMGLSDLYPFVIPTAVLEKLRFIHQVISPGPVNFMAADAISLDTAGATA